MSLILNLTGSSAASAHRSNIFFQTDTGAESLTTTTFSSGVPNLSYKQNADKTRLLEMLQKQAGLNVGSSAKGNHNNNLFGVSKYIRVMSGH